jgi:hypothetical protein
VDKGLYLEDSIFNKGYAGDWILPCSGECTVVCLFAAAVTILKLVNHSLYQKHWVQNILRHPVLSTRIVIHKHHEIFL